MSTLKTHNLQSADSGSVNIALTANAGMIVTGISTFTGNIDANGDLDVDGHTELDNVNIAGVATFSQGGSEVVRINSGGLLVYNDVSFFGDSTHAYWDKSANQFSLNDNTKLSVGSGSDLQIYHGSNVSHIAENGTGPLRLSTDEFQVMNSAQNKTMIYAAQNLAVSLNYNGNTKIQTTNTGAVVTGILTATSFSGDGSTLTGISAGLFAGGATGIHTASNVGIQTTNITRASLVGAGNSLVGMYIGDGSILFNKTLNRTGGYYISTEVNALNAGPVTLDATMTLDGAWVIV